MYNTIMSFTIITMPTPSRSLTAPSNSNGSYTRRQFIVNESAGG